jgi:hypothetical protein
VHESYQTEWEKLGEAEDSRVKSLTRIQKNLAKAWEKLNKYKNIKNTHTQIQRNTQVQKLGLEKTREKIGKESLTHESNSFMPRSKSNSRFSEFDS